MRIWKHSFFTNEFLYSLKLLLSFYFSSGLRSSPGLAVKSASKAMIQNESFLSYTCKMSSSSRSVSMMLQSASMKRALGLVEVSPLINLTRSLTDSSQCCPLIQAYRSLSFLLMVLTPPNPCMLKMILFFSYFSQVFSSWSCTIQRSSSSPRSRLTFSSRSIYYIRAYFEYYKSHQAQDISLMRLKSKKGSKERGKLKKVERVCMSKIQLIMIEIGQKRIQRAKRSHTLQDLHKFQGKISKIPRHLSAHSVPFKSIIKSDADYACQNSILKAKNQQRQLKAMIGNINRETLFLINSIRPKKQQKRQPKRQFISDRELQNSNAKILLLQGQIDSLEKQTKVLSLKKSRKELPLMIEVIQEQKQKLAAVISELKRVIQRNGRQLVRKNETAEQKTELFGLYRHSRALQAKKIQLIEVNWKVMEENETISIKIRQLQSKIKLYQEDILKAASDDASTREIKYQQKTQKKDLLQRNKDRHRRHLQSVYFQKIKDLQYQMNGCEAISNKIYELQARINNGKAEISTLKAELTPLFVDKSSLE